jgi:hypothetical protein
MYVLTSTTNPPALSAAIQRLYPKSMRWENGSWFLQSSGTAQTVMNQIAEASGVKSGVIIFRVTADYYGYSQASFWDWIAQTFKDESDG